jgi:hypothetical protein
LLSICVQIRQRNDQIGRCSGGVGIFYKEKLYQMVQLLINIGTNVLWMILKVDETICTGVCYNPPKGSKYENPRFFEELESEVLEIKSTVVELDIIVMGDLNARCGDLIPRTLMEEEEENGWYKDNLITGSCIRSEDKVVNVEGRKLISFCEILNLEEGCTTTVEQNKDDDPSKEQRHGVDPVRAREYFKGLLGKGVGEWGLRKEDGVLRPEGRWKEELDRKIEMEEIHKYLRKAVGTDGYPTEFWKELCRKKHISKILVKLMNNIYQTKDFPLGWKTSMLHMIYKSKGNKRDPANYRGISLLSTLSKVYKGVLARLDREEGCHFSMPHGI